MAASGVGRLSWTGGRTCGSAGGTGAVGAGMPSAAAFLRPSLLASRRNGEGPDGGVDGIAIPGMGRRVAAVETGPADDEVIALWGSEPARSATFGWPATDSLGLLDSPTESDSLGVAWDTLANGALGRVSASLAGPAAGGVTAASGVSGCAAGGALRSATGGTFASAAGALTSGAGGTFASKAGRVLTSGRGGTWALGGGSLNSGAGGFLAFPADGPVATAFAAVAVGTSGGDAGEAFASGAGRARTFPAGDTFLSVAGGAAAALAVGTPRATAGSRAGGPFTVGPTVGAWASGALGVGGAWDRAGRGRNRRAGQVHAPWAAARSRSARLARPRSPESARPRLRVGTAVSGPASLGPAYLAGAGRRPFAAGTFASAPGALAAATLPAATLVAPRHDLPPFVPGDLLLRALPV